MRPAWTEGLNKEQKEEIVASQMKLPEKFTEHWQRYTQLEANAKSAVVVPPKDASEEAWKEYRQKMDIPATSDEYAFERPSLPEGLPFDDALEKWFKNVSSDLKLPRKTAQALFQKWNDMRSESYKAQQVTAAKESQQLEEARQKSVTSGREALQSKWGDRYSDRLLGAKQTFANDKIISEKLREKFTKSELENDPEFIQLLDLVSRATKSDSRLGLATEMGSTPHEAGIDYGESFTKRYASGQ